MSLISRAGLSWLWELLSFLALVSVGGCQSSAPPSSAEKQGQAAFTLRQITPEEAAVILSDLELGTAASGAEPDTVVVSGLPAEIEKASVVLALIDTNEPFVAGTLAPAALVRSLPSNEQIAEAIGNIAVGTFTHPPGLSHQARAIIDVHGEAVVAVAPARVWPQIRAVTELGPQAREDPTRLPREQTASNREHSRPKDQPTESVITTTVLPDDQTVSPPASAKAKEPNEAARPAAVARESPQLSRSGQRETPRPQLSTVQPLGGSTEVIRGVLKPASRIEKAATTSPVETPISFPNGDDVLELSLPEKIELAQLLDLAGTYLNLDCIYEPEKVGNQMITLKLHSKQRSEMRVKDLYCLLETVLKFKGLVMTRREGNFVTIVPTAEALEVDPQLVDPNNRSLQAGDIVVTRIFDLQYADVTSVANMLQTMKLSVAVSPVADTRTLFVTCYAHRMARVEQLVDLLDRPGKSREFRFRQLKYTMAATLSRKLLALAQELQGITVTIGATDTNPATPAPSPRRPSQSSAEAKGSPSAPGPAIYLDTDERTNRILMIGPSEELETVEGLIDTLDIRQQDLRTIQVYAFEHVEASSALDKLLQLGVVDRTEHGTPRTTKAAAGSGSAAETGPGEKPQAILLETTNSLLVNATAQQHEQVEDVIRYIDVAPQDKRTLKIYYIKHVDAQDVARKLQQLQAVDSVAAPAPRAAKITQAGGPVQATPAVLANSTEPAATDDSQLVVLETTNSLLVNATAQQHQRIQAIIDQVDTEATKEMIPYEIYFLENQDPEQMAAVLGKLIHETVTSTDGKVEKVVPKTEEPITIIPDKNTFSLIVRANRKDQDWIAGLVERLDKRRPQVLIDVTLVEITEMDTFTYDLTAIASATDLAHGSGLTGTLVPGQTPVTSADVTNKLNASGNSHFAEFESSGGALTAFYGDKHINLLLQAMQTKNYGRILAKPKILVNDNEPGLIKTADTTYVAKKSSIPVTSGAGGTQTSLIQTAVDYQSYEAGITLNITPHISQGDLLRLDIQLERSDFRPTGSLEEKPPDKTSSELKTTVFAPDASTIILGGLLRLNQSKGGSKVPLLGDIPLIGGLFRSVDNRDNQNKLYIFVKTEIIRPAGLYGGEASELKAVSRKDREALEKHERQFQNYQSWPGVKSKPMEPAKVLDAR